MFSENLHCSACWAPREWQKSVTKIPEVCNPASKRAKMTVHTRNEYILQTRRRHRIGPKDKEIENVCSELHTSLAEVTDLIDCTRKQYELAWNEPTVSTVRFLRRKQTLKAAKQIFWHEKLKYAKWSWEKTETPKNFLNCLDSRSASDRHSKTYGSAYSSNDKVRSTVNCKVCMTRPQNTAITWTFQVRSVLLKWAVGLRQEGCVQSGTWNT